MDPTPTPSPEISNLKARLKATWEAGDYGIFAKHLEKGALEFFDRLNIAPGNRLLDLACGAGQLTIPAARKGIEVTGLDLAANLVEQARSRAKAEGLQIQVDEGDAEDLPYPDSSFDVVMSLIGVMFAPRPELVAKEMARVCRSGGKIVMGNWTPEGHVGQMFKIVGKHVPPPSLMPSPLLWGNEQTCRQRLGSFLSDLQISRHSYPLDFPFPPETVVDFFIEYYGPTNRAYAQLNEQGRDQFRKDLIDLWQRNNVAANGTTQVPSEYIVVTGIRAHD
ncbi:MAG TPA: class I SAM-dependent methyltransferase [Oligoflexus sp.]|uniref:class I SAM-dependent methyltransferase n=1 Tax=Oligoflexus sp. TaxID=1971216 RepID=UPI002D6D3482|nr:class I SAM-dependent methyltransferase [Oligoflexus sp.]HYX34687.1 class I SAM-dependent methyltransferase [Oligoflexus sp.]